MLAAPLIPYIDLPELVLLKPGALWAGFPPEPFSIKPFGTLVAIGVYVGAYLAVRQGKRLGIHERSLTSFIFWVVAGGFIGGHMLETEHFVAMVAAEGIEDGPRAAQRAGRCHGRRQ